MAAKRIYSPPLLDVDNTDIWLREIELWRCLTELDIKQKRPAIYCCLVIFVKHSLIKSLYAKDMHSLAYMAYDKFQTFHRPVEVSMVDYLNEFERLYNQIKHHDMELPKGALA